MSATEAQLKLFDRRYRGGLCRYCGGPREDHGRVGCNGCRDKQKARVRKRYREGETMRQKFQAEGKCRCGEVIPEDWTINGRKRLICPGCKARNEKWRAA